MQWIALICVTVAVFIAADAVGVPSGWDAAITVALAIAFVASEERLRSHGPARSTVSTSRRPIQIARHAVAAGVVLTIALVVSVWIDVSLVKWVVAGALVYLAVIVPLMTFLPERPRRM